ncbi:MAG TPA: hypothetical protein VMR73_00720 [Candidatus Paceibacterota bacterium]|nr:hypothetical protein [Candidatus Paceibacterota bacterium]
MFNISLYLGRFKKISDDKTEKKRIVIEACISVADVVLKPEQILLKGNAASITADPIIKSVLFMKKEKILTFLNERPETKTIARID